MLGQFLNGLKEDIRVEVRLLNPISLEQAMELALRVEEKNRKTGLKKSGVSWFKGGQYSSVSFKSPQSNGSTAYILHSSPTSVRSWSSQASESQSSVSSPKSITPSSTMKMGGQMRRLTDK